MSTRESSLTPAWLGFDPTYSVVSSCTLAEEFGEMVASGFAIEPSCGRRVPLDQMSPSPNSIPE